MEAFVGDEIVLEANLNFENLIDKTLTWTSSDTNVAIVENGIVKCVGPGNAKITVTTSNGKSAYCKFVVKSIMAESIMLDTNNIEVNIGDSFILSALILPENTTNKNVTWSSSNENVAVVDNGVVYCIGLGEAIITATTCNGLSASCEVNVIPIIASSLTLSDTELSLFITESADLTATVAPANTTDKTITWSSSNSMIANISMNGTVSACGVGTATITANVWVVLRQHAK